MVIGECGFYYYLDIFQMFDMLADRYIKNTVNKLENG